MKRKNKRNFERMDTLRKKELDNDGITKQRSDVEFSEEIGEEQNMVDVGYRKVYNIDKIREQKDDVEYSNEISEYMKMPDVNVPRMGFLSWIGGIVLISWAVGLMFSFGGLMINWLLLVAAVVFIVDMISRYSARDIK